tara:strand:- start:231 stop:1046 length:816 start_codon:yes stop_codon:yes gene_type:complete
MAKMTLLEIVQDILNDADSDQVNSINDTVESLQVAQIVKTSYFEMIANRNWPHLRRTVRLVDVLDTTRPTHLRLPEGTKELLLFNYNKRKEDDLTRDRYQSVQYQEPEVFLDRSNRRNSTESNVGTAEDFGGVNFHYRNDIPASYYTSFDDDYVVLDAYDGDIETTLHADQTQCVIYFDPVWVHDDSALPDLPSEAFPALLEEAKSTAFVVLKQEANVKSEQKARRQQRWLSRKARKISGGVKYPDYGRKRRFTSSTRSTLIDKDGTLNVL